MTTVNLKIRKVSEAAYAVFLCALLLIVIMEISNGAYNSFVTDRAFDMYKTQASKWTYDMSLPENREIMRRVTVCYSNKAYATRRHSSNYTENMFGFLSIVESQVLANSNALRDQCLNEEYDAASYQAQVIQAGPLSIEKLKKSLK